MCPRGVFRNLALLLLILRCIATVKIRHSGGRHALLRFHGHGYSYSSSLSSPPVGLWPSVFNVATKASITANATCGLSGREEFCRLGAGDTGREPGGRAGRCGACDANSPDPARRHPVENAIDGTNRWWQSPTLYQGEEFEQVAITLDLKQVYQVVDVIVKAGNAPRPGSWVLERSLDGLIYHPWQFYVISDDECLQVHGIPATPGKPKYVTDTDVICTSYYSKLHPLENGEIHTSLVHGRPGANDSSPELLAFTRARYVRLRFLRHRAAVAVATAHHGGLGAQALAKKLYYAIRDITIGGQCVCNGHARSCRHNVQSGHPECDCQHGTCGPHCERCCPLMNQRAWGAGSSRDARVCEQCQCHGHATSCVYDEQVEAKGLSLDMQGRRTGGGVCVNCTHFTTGINCEQCLPGYYRPADIPPDAAEPCLPCDCDVQGSIECRGDGSCVCRADFAGLRCDRCAPGHAAFPACTPCQCDSRGTILVGDCEKECLCKANVEGDRCDICKEGYFALRADNIEGCSTCYCSGATNVCEPAFITREKVETLQEWLVSDITGTETVKPTLDTDTNWISIGNYELPGIEAYYWLAPKPYIGNQLQSYGSSMVFHVHWVVMRGDTSGKPTTGPNLILVGKNGLRIAYDDATYTVTNTTVKITLKEDKWYHIPFGVKDIVTRLRRTEYRGDPVTRFQFMSILTDVEHVLLRAKFHTDQIEGSLQQAAIVSDTAGEEVEKCACPTGYTGLSCETCDYGYVQVMMNTTAHVEQGICIKCPCNGHSPSCTAFTSNTCTCDHNTVGEMCERCSPGYYGNPLAGTPEDCRRCACPLLEDSNNFSPSCQLDNSEDGEAYVCTQCPVGYTGDHCEICDYGFFGSPTTLGSTCQACSCGGGPCDRRTGQCLSCRGNTAGWRCERCKPGHWGDAANANCQPCECDPLGALTGDCDEKTGQCQCRERVTGRTCDRCEAGFGNMTAECTPCSCHSMGAISNVCDAVSGVCDCKPGVEGFRCDACQHLHYGFSEEGCQGCACNSAGSELTTCDIVTGQCRCRSHVIGRNCDSCERGYWGLDSGRGCFKCECDDIGSVDGTCDQKSKQCYCKPGIGGLKCDTCQHGYFGFSSTGCKACEYCKKPGHICDPDTGRCVCPPNSRGESCERCAPNSFGYEIGIGCKSCNCAVHGSEKKQCDSRTGQCECKIGYTGVHCDKCTFGYYGYPRCRKCDCDRAGTEPGNCHSSGLCSCDDSGQCACKAHVVGKKCNECRDGTFGLHLDNPGGCTQCFCFGRTAHCTESNLTIGHTRLNTSREFEIDYIFKKQYSPIYNRPFQKYLSQENDLLVIPGVYDDIVKVQVDSQIDQAIYWRLPNEFLGDKILSYGGYLRFVTETHGGTTSLPFNKYPLIQLRGNDRIILEHYQLLPSPHNKHEIRFHESLWKWKNQPHAHVSRDLLMVALQKVQHIFIRANNAVNFNKVVLHNVTLDTAIMLPGSPPPLAKGVELCECPRQYNSSSCQNPSIGFYRWYNPEHVNGTIIINLIGEAKPCECNGRSNVCDTETGHCLNCTDNTTGSNCQYCSEGFYGNPLHGKCKPCPCPTKDRNFSRKCHRLHHGGFKCVCKTGYSGPKCDTCKSGYFGNPEEDGGSCKPCNCNKYGSASDECDEKTGQCNCRPGMTGKDCSICESPRFVLQISGCKPCDNCTQWLLNDLDKMSENLDKTYSDYILYDRVRQLYDKLNEMSNQSSFLQKDLDDYKFLQQQVKDYSLDSINNLQDKAQRIKDYDLIERSNKQSSDIKKMNDEIDDLYSNIDLITEELEKTIEDLQNFGTSHIEVKNAVRQGRKVLEDIKKIPMYHPDLIGKRKYCSDLLESIKNIDTIYSHDINEITMDLEDFKNRLKDMKNIISKNQNTLNQQEETSADVAERMEDIKEQIDELNGINFESVNETQKLLNNAKELLKKAESSHRDLKDSTEFDNLFAQLEKGKFSDISIPHLRKLVESAKKHAKELERRAEIIKKSFNVSHEADLALKASRVYQEIIDILNEARDTAKTADNTINDANKKINPRGRTSLYDAALEAVEMSEDIKEDAEILKGNVEDLHDQKELLNISISDSQNTLWRTGLKDNQLNSNIHNLTLNKKDMLAIIHKANAISNKMKNIYKNATSIKEDIQYKLRPELDKLKKNGEHLVSHGEETVSVVERNLKNSMDILLSLETNNHVRKTNLTKWNDTISRKLDELKSRILKAKQAADGVRVSLTNAQNTICTRSYKPFNFGPTTTNKLSLTLSLNNTDKNSSLFYIQTMSKDFMALQLVNKHIQYLWNLGGDTGELKTKLPRDPNHDGWFKIKVERTANIAKLTVYNKETEDKPHEVRGSSSSDFTRFDVGPHDQIWVGGALVTNEEVQLGNQLTSGTGVSGCLSDVVFDGKPIGLWNFVNSTHVRSCSLCNKGVATIKTDNCCYFNGRGYSVMPRDDSSIYRPSTSSIRFDFNTYDENALLFLAVDKPNGRFVSISLKNGRLQFHIEYGGKSVLILTTKEKYNNGSKTSVSASREFSRKYGGEKALLEVNNEHIGGKPMNMPEKNSFPNLIDASYYVGGVPPDFYFKSNGTTKTLHTHSSFLGCIEEINIDGNRYSPLDEKHYERYGVEPSCLNKSFKIAGFEGSGYIEMPEQTLNSGSTFGFVFRSQQKDALLLESVNPNQIDSYYMISIVSGKIVTKINIGKKIITLTSNTTVNDGHYHVLFIKIQKRTVKLRIDDELHDESPIDAKNLNIVGNIFLGGLPDNLSNTIKIRAKENLTGTIKDFIFNDRLIPYNELLNFEKVKIGRPGPLPDVSTPSEVSTLMMRGRKPLIPEPLPQCHRIPNYSLEAGAVKFGDAPHSYVQHIFKSNNFWNKDYTIELEFRTFYLNGLIFVSPGIKEKNRHYISLILNDHAINLVVKGKRKREVLLHQKYDDGQWHHIVIQNFKKKLTLTVDGQSETKKVPKKMNLANMIYIGGLPANGSHLPEAFVNKLHPFRGCIRNLKVNNQHQDLIKDIGNHNNVGQCFPRVEIGSYFAGDAYAVYKYYFVVHTQLELQFEFRTSEQNGILLSIADPDSPHGLSLELHNGAVVMMGNMGNNGPSKVEANLSTEYSLCDNKWHKVRAFYSKEEMAVKVDGVFRSTLAINSTFMDSKIENALYIGGLPDDAPLGTLHTRENFKGCIRNVVIEHHITDWTDMDELQNILLNSCPVLDS